MAICSWGLIPCWARDPSIGSRLINARSETLTEKPAFREALVRRRCLVPADGFFEWPRGSPVYIRRRDGDLFAFAGLWDRWRAPDGEVRETVTIITVPPNGLVAKFHHRMAAILTREDEARWIDPGRGMPELLGMLRPCPAEELEAWPVSRNVGNPGNDRPDNIENITEMRPRSLFD
jgi:putative SOS response-associated peptidase YedK